MTYNFKQEGVAYYLQVRIFLQKSMVAVYSFISEPGLVLLARHIQLEEAKYLARRRVCLVREKVVVARFGFIWQLLSNHKVISLKRFVSSFTTKLCNQLYFLTIFNTPCMYRKIRCDVRQFFSSVKKNFDVICVSEIF